MVRGGIGIWEVAGVEVGSWGISATVIVLVFVVAA